ncbi:MAG TPA: FKBP-type peptidyl-prolyl cis-trans isomerase [Bacteroidia bacterium]|nr:FKBP-type peptidyl-prolyl cis-trans isomerase [Bacteroidia bacterium]
MKKKFLPGYAIMLLLFPLLFISSCSSGQENQEKMDKEKLKETLIRANKLYMNKQSDDIDDYVKRHHLQMDTTATGLRIKIDKLGSGPRPEFKNNVTVKYIVSLIDGTECYRSDSLGPLTFSMNHDDVPQGLREAVSMMRAGDKAFAILPSHLGYGLTGDAKKIPSNATLIYQIELVKIE